jgi:hypothetical protein
VEESSRRHVRLVDLRFDLGEASFAEDGQHRGHESAPETLSPPVGADADEAEPRTLRPHPDARDRDVLAVSVDGDEVRLRIEVWRLVRLFPEGLRVPAPARRSRHFLTQQVVE